MPSWVNLTSISAAFTIAAFIAEVLKAFPRYSELRRSFLLASGGFFIGSLLTAASGIQLSIAGSNSPFTLLMMLCVLGAGLFLFAAVFSEDKIKKKEYYAVVLGMILAFCVLLLINSIYASEARPVGIIDPDLTFSEKLTLANQARILRNWERAHYMLESAVSGLDDGDPRAKAINQRIQDIQRLEMASDLSTLNQASQ